MKQITMSVGGLNREVSDETRKRINNEAMNQMWSIINHKPKGKRKSKPIKK